MKLAPNGVLWMIAHDFHIPHGATMAYFESLYTEALIYVSVDNGHSWHLRSSIPYPDAADPTADPMWRSRDGFTEPDIAFMPDGSLLCMLRTTDGNGIGPMYLSRSTDDGHTWTAPTVFDNLGVFPIFLNLNNGVTLLTYGRSGLYIRATEDPSGMNWEERIVIVPPQEIQTETCSYANFIAIDDNTALLIYSDFNYPDPDRTPCKSILVRTIHVTVE